MKFLLILVALLIDIGLASAEFKCGYLPRDVTLKRGERQKLVFWTDQVYDEDQTTTTEKVDTTTKDFFLEAVNGGSNQDEDQVADTTTNIPELSETTTIEVVEDMQLSLDEQLMTDTLDLAEDIEVVTENTPDVTEPAETATEEVEEVATTLTSLLEEEILDDDDVDFEEDFGTPVNNEEVSIFDPEDHIVDIVEGSENVELPHDVELLETSDPPSTIENEKLDETTTVQPSDVERVFEYTTIAYPESGPTFEAVEAEDAADKKPATNSEGLLLETTTPSASEIKDTKPNFEAVIAEDYDLEEEKRPVVAAVEAEKEDEARPGATDSNGLLIDTTTSKDKLVDDAPVEFAIEAVIAEEEEEENRTDEKGLLLETTTGAGGPLNKIAKVTEVLEKLPRAEDEDVAIEPTLQDLSTEGPSDLIVNITDPSDKPGSILTTLIDGFLLQKQPVQEDPDESTNVDSADGFPVTNILSGIYNLVSSYIQPSEDEEEEEPITAIPQSAINVHNMPRDQLIVEAADPLPLDAPNDEIIGSENAPPLPVLPMEFFRGAPIDIKPKPRSPVPEGMSGPVLLLNEKGSKGGTREPVTISLPDLINEENGEPRSLEDDLVESIRSSSSQFRDFVDSQPDPIRQHFIFKREAEEDTEEEQTTTEEPVVEETTIININEEDIVNCNWNIKTEPGLYLLATFHNLSAPFTVGCEGAYIEVERENNGFEARWCGNRVTTGGSRPHVIFAKNEVRITLFDDGSQGKELPTGFAAEIEVIDLFDGQQHSEDLKNIKGYSNVRKLAGRTS